MTTKDYIEIYDKYPSSINKYPGWEKDLEALKKFNRNLLEKYPWLTPINSWSGKRITDCIGSNGEEGFWPGDPDNHPEYDYEYTILDNMPEGWRIAFGDQMVEEIHQELAKYNFVNDYKIVQVKEKYGGLRWYDNGTPVGKLSEEYKDIIWKPSEHEGREQPEYDFKTEVLKYNGYDHYISFFDRKNSNMTEAEIEEYNKEAIFYYKLYKIVEKCKVSEIISKYENLSFKVCIDCGDPAEWESKGWISPYCTSCAERHFECTEERLAKAGSKENHNLEEFYSKLEKV